MTRKRDGKLTSFVRTPKARSESMQALTNQTPYTCITRDARVIIIQDDGYDEFKLKLNLSCPTVAASLICIACLVVEIIQS